MPEIYDKNPETISKYNGEKELNKKYAKLAKKITDNVKTKIGGVKTTSPEYWGLREVLTEEEVDILLTMKLRKWYTFDELYQKNQQQFSKEHMKELVDLMCVHGIIEYDYYDHYDDNGPTKDNPGEKPNNPELRRSRSALYLRQGQSPEVLGYPHRLSPA